MKKQLFQLLILHFLFFSISSCEFESDQLRVEEEEISFSFENNFDFKTSRELSIQTNDSKTIFDLYYLDDKQEENSLGRYSNNLDVVEIKVPSYVEEIYYRSYDDNGKVALETSYSSYAASILLTDGINSLRKSTTSTCVERLYAVNGSAGFYELDVSNEEFNSTQLPQLPGGSIANALDQENGIVYVNVNTTLYKYDVVAETFEVAFTSNPFNRSYPRFEFKDNTFYISNNNVMYTINASTNEVIQRYDIEGFVNSDGGGDLAFASDGQLYLACFSGLYKFTELNASNGVATIERISAENFPYQLTSMAIDRDDRIFVGTNDASSRLIEISKEDGAYEIVKTYDFKINDLTSWKCDFSSVSAISGEDLDGDGIGNEDDDDLDGDGIIDEKDDDVDGDGIANENDSDMDGDNIINEEDPDTDGDGVIDILDEYPNDPVASGNIYTPSKLGFGTLSFEDNWPLKGDYDFNDVVIKYQFTSLINKDNKCSRMKIDLRLVAAGGTYRNGFGIQLPIDKSKVESVIGHNAPSSMIDEAGLEQGQSKPVIILFTNSLAEFGGGAVINSNPNAPEVPEKVYSITVEFKELIPAADLSGIPFNPFIFINGERGRECHLKDKAPTDLFNDSYLFTEDDDSDEGNGRYFVSKDNAPFAIDIIHNFRYPRENVRIDKAYNFFLDWGQSGGQLYNNWYTDANGNRTNNNIYKLD